MDIKSKLLGTNAKADLIRAIQHFPVGLLNAWLFIKDPQFGWAMLVGFLAYEIANDWRKIDWSYKDIIGWLEGLGTGLTIWIIIKEVLNATT